jgi:aminopeptidase
VKKMLEMSTEEFTRCVKKLAEFMRYCQRVKRGDSYLVVNRNADLLAEAAKKAAENCGLRVQTLNLDAKKPYKHFPQKLTARLLNKTPKAGVGLFDYTSNPDWNLKEVGARIELLHKIIEEVPISWAHSPGITADMAVNGPLQCDYKKMAEESDRLLQKLKDARKIHITSQAGTDLEVQVPTEVRFDTDCTIVPPNVYGRPGKFGNLPVGEVWSQKDEIIQVLNKTTSKKENRSYPIKQTAQGKVICNITAGGYPGRINPKKPIIASFKDGVLTQLHSDDPALDGIRKDILNSQSKYGLSTVLEEVGIGLNDRARVTGNMLEDEKIKGTCHIAPGNIRCHVDMLIDKPTITIYDSEGTAVEIMKNGIPT